MQIINDPKLDFKDVLIIPRISNIGSRAEVDITRSFTYLSAGGEFYSTPEYSIPIIASNMDGVGTFSMAKALGEFGIFTAITKDAPLEAWGQIPPRPST
jgi:GMP reductase